MTMGYTMEYLFKSDTGKLTTVALCDDCAEYHEENPEFGTMVDSEPLSEWQCDGINGRYCW